VAGSGVELLDSMANTTAQLAAERWVVMHCLPELFKGVSFSGRVLQVKWGGKFAFDAVSNDGKIVGLISTSAAHTASGKSAIAKFQKIKADALYLLNVVGAVRLFMVFTEKSMLAHFEKEKTSGRFPLEIEFLHVTLPEEIHAQVIEARRVASAETTPTQKINKGNKYHD
jgi:hypothetical protein